MLSVHTGEKVALARKYHRPALTQEDLAAKLEINRATLARWESEGRFRPEVLAKIAEITGLKTSWFEDGADQPPGPTDQATVRESSGLLEVRSAPMVKIPVLGAVSAGDGLTHGDSDEQFFNVPYQFGFPDYAAWFVEGDSMMPLLQPGDYAIFREHPHPRRGHVCAIQLNGAEIVAKRVAFEDGRWVMQSLNPIYQDEPVPPGHRVLGYLVGYYRSIGGDETFRHNRSGLVSE